MTPATKIARIDISYLPSSANLIELNPIQTPTSVKIFGNITLVFFDDTSLKFFLVSIFYFLAKRVSPAIVF